MGFDPGSVILKNKWITGKVLTSCVCVIHLGVHHSAMLSDYFVELTSQKGRS